MIFTDDECPLCPNVKISRQQVEGGGRVAFYMNFELAGSYSSITGVQDD